MYVYALTAMRKLRLIYLVIILLTLGFTSCDQGTVYHEYVTIEESGWHRDSIIHYEILIDDSLALNDFYITIRNNIDYPYSNLYLFISTKFPNGHVTNDTIECILADKGGRWLGSGSGRMKAVPVSQGRSEAFSTGSQAQ